MRLRTLQLLGRMIRQLLEQQCRPASTAAAEAATAQRKFGSHKAEPADATAAAAKVDAAPTSGMEVTVLHCVLYQISSSFSTMTSMLASSSGATRSANATVSGFASSGPGVDDASPVHRPCPSTMRGDEVGHGRRSHHASRLH